MTERTDFAECVNYIETNIEHGWGMPPEIHKDVVLLIQCIREQRAALLAVYGGKWDAAQLVEDTLVKWNLP